MLLRPFIAAGLTAAVLGWLLSRWTAPTWHHWLAAAALFVVLTVLAFHFF